MLKSGRNTFKKVVLVSFDAFGFVDAILIMSDVLITIISYFLTLLTYVQILQFVKGCRIVERCVLNLVFIEDDGSISHA